MIVCSLIAVLTAMAIPSYRQYVMRTHRADAIEKLLAAAACQQRLYANEFSFDTHRCLPNGAAEKYTFRYEPEGTSGAVAFTVIAEPNAAQAADVCGSLSLAHTGLRMISADSERLNACWQSR
jgi:type IV pilus assembly protein PilE